jgi:hypothetical protein
MKMTNTGTSRGAARIYREWYEVDIQNISEDFNQWNLKDPDGSSIAHKVAAIGNLPANFPAHLWKLMDGDGQDGQSVAHVAVWRKKPLPSFPDEIWALKDRRGRPVAHVAAERGNLTAHFSQWGLTDRNGNTTAHIAARNGTLPAWYAQWELADRYGWTVAHEAALYGNLPEEFTQWHLEDARGRTVAQIALNSNLTSESMIDAIRAWMRNTDTKQKLPVGFEKNFNWEEDNLKRLSHIAAEEGALPRIHNDEIWEWDQPSSSEFVGGRKLGLKVAHVAAWYRTLPPDFPDDKWKIRDNSQRSVAHIAAMSGSLPAHFAQWNIVDGNGDTVAHVAARNANLRPGYSEWGLKDAKGITVAEAACQAYGASPEIRKDAKAWMDAQEAQTEGFGPVPQ